MKYERFAELMAQRGVSAYRVAKETGVSQSMLSNWRTGRSIPKTESLMKIAEYFGVTVEYLMNDDEPTFFDPELPFKGNAEAYYLDPETAKIAQEMFDRPELRGLFDASRKLSPEDIKAVQAMVEHLWKVQHSEE